MKKYPLFNVSDLNEGKVILQSNGNSEDVFKVLVAAYKDTDIMYRYAASKYYWHRLGKIESYSWTNISDKKALSNLPIRSTNYFLKQLNNKQQWKNH